MTRKRDGIALPHPRLVEAIDAATLGVSVKGRRDRSARPRGTSARSRQRVSPSPFGARRVCHRGDHRPDRRFAPRDDGRSQC